MNKRKIPILSIVLYAIAGLLVIYTIWSVNRTASYISDMVAQGQLTVKGNEFDIVNFYMSNSAQYAIFAVILFTLGWILQKISTGRLGNPKTGNKEASSVQVTNSVEEEEDFQTWFQNNEK